MSNSDAYENLVARIEGLKAIAAISRDREKKPVLKAVARAIVQYEITLPELRTALASVSRAGRTSSRRAAGSQGGGSDHPLSGRTIPAKYRDPKTGQAWSGRGSTPLWLRELESQGIKRDTLLVKRRKS